MTGTVTFLCFFLSSFFTIPLYELCISNIEMDPRSDFIIDSAFQADQTIFSPRIAGIPSILTA